VELDRAIEAAAEALRVDQRYMTDRPETLARIAVEAAAPHLAAVEILTVKDGKQAIVAYTNWKQRAERAEAEAERLKKLSTDHFRLAVRVGNDMEAERALADRLAEALRPPINTATRAAALAAWEEARRG
jgi:hypothetical protein